MQIDYKILDARLGSGFPIPAYSTQGSAGLDLRAMISEPTLLKAGESLLVASGISVYIKDANYCGLILPRSGLGHKHGIVLGNLVGLIDSDYQGEIKVSLWNRSNTDYTIEVGERIAQLVIMPVLQVGLNQVTQFTATDRGEGGFGSSGKN